MTMRWADLEPDPRIADALRQAGARPEGGDQNQKRGWSERFANACAVAIARTIAEARELRGKTVRPVDPDQGVEPLVPLGSGVSKRIDVTVTDPLLGLEIGVSLKGLNFRDGRSGNYDKNLTGRLYELGDEVRVVHEHLPHAFMAGVFFLPLGAVDDKQNGNSSFANAVYKLARRTGRIDPSLAHHAPRCDIAFVALYTTGSEPEGFPPGLVRFLDVTEQAPPRRGRPRVHTTLSLQEAVERIVARATVQDDVLWADPEPNE
ncbi:MULTISPECIES: hypothetical protein [Marichromatium]|uniref:Restriction endonuclease n=2 Tax=Marichromatium TaxID=85076 RepID=A0ABR5VLL2_MARGR|nr:MULTISPECIES: hypothetical protein [Marichromatium]KXX66400.1 hypothetical protein AY586_00330 [Marichromatium gracile]NKN34194.1 hypothetical protein [Marichromatium bheemlicum]